MGNHQDIIKKVEESLDSMRPYLQADGGNVEVVEITEDMVVRLRLLGSCESCPQSYMTMSAGIEEAVKRAVPQVKSVEAVNMKSKPGVF